MPPKKSEAPGISAAMQAEREKLPSELRPYFDSLVETYKFYALVSYGFPYVNYKVLASIVRDGWRRSAEPLE